MNRTDRLVALVMYMQGRRLVRAEDMAAHFEVSVRTIYRDLAALSESGVPITGEPGVGYSLLRSYHLPPVMLTAEEASALFVGAEMARQFTDGSLQPPLEAALLKLRAVLPKDRQDYVDQLSKRTVVMGPPCTTGAPAVDRQWLLPLQDAAVRHRVVLLHYRGRGKEIDTVREVEPLGLMFHGGAWYMVGWCRLRGGMRHFRLDRIQRAEVKNETFVARAEFSLARHLQEVSQRESMVPVRLWFSERALERARRESYVPIIDERARDGGMEVSMATFSIQWVALWLLSFGGEAVVLEPDALRDQVTELARNILDRHGAGMAVEAQLA
jgi:predicted DNA-binding transcriptional regulator YafY